MSTDTSRYCHRKKSTTYQRGLSIRSFILGVDASWSEEIIAGYQLTLRTQGRKWHRRCNISAVNIPNKSSVSMIEETYLPRVLVTLVQLHHHQHCIVTSLSSPMHPNSDQIKLKWDVANISSHRLNWSVVVHLLWQRVRQAAKQTKQRRPCTIHQLYKHQRTQILQLVVSQQIRQTWTAWSIWLHSLVQKCDRIALASTSIPPWDLKMNRHNKNKKWNCHISRRCLVPQRLCLWTLRENFRNQTWTSLSAPSTLNTKTSRFWIPNSCETNNNASWPLLLLPYAVHCNYSQNGYLLCVQAEE